MDTVRRADEMIKYVSFKDWTALSQRDQKTGLKSIVAAKIIQTIAFRVDAEGFPDMQLEAQVADAITDKCFQVKADTYEGLAEEAKILKRSLVCYPLMWDQVQVGAAPEKPLSNAVKLFDPAKPQTNPLLLKRSWKQTPALCARIALSLIAEPLLHARKGYSRTTCQGHMRFSQCLQMQNFNCICLEKCFRAALRRLVKFESECGAKPELLAERPRTNVFRKVISSRRKRRRLSRGSRSSKDTETVTQLRP